jgi:hypothetical protein
MQNQKKGKTYTYSSTMKDVLIEVRIYSYGRKEKSWIK